MKIPGTLNWLKRQNRFNSHTSHIEEISSREAEYKDLNQPFTPMLNEWIEKKHINLFTHQVEAIQTIRSGKHVILTTPTASGKTFAYNLPVIEKLLKSPKSRALYIFPTKALTNDQHKTILSIDKELDKTLKPAVYDGDTPKQKRSSIRKKSRIILSNPYMLHMILPWHHLWADFFCNLDFVVLDEAHYYRGVFGSNMAMIMRRLKRICSAYKSNPQFFLSTATIANPVTFSEKLIGEPCVHISKNGSPSGTKHFVLYNPYYVENEESTANVETKWLMETLIKKDIQTLCFSLSRRNTEFLTKEIQQYFERRSPLNKKSIIASYRGGYLPEQRKEIENNLKLGNLKGIVSTNALEAGIDIGSLDAVLMNGYPGTMISTWQQAGRSGRGKEDSLVILIGRQNPLDQYFLNHPEEFFNMDPEFAIIDLHNQYILCGHLLCAAKELPLTKNDSIHFGNYFLHEVLYLTNEGLLKSNGKRWLYGLLEEPFKKVSINNIGSDRFFMYSETGLIETLDREQAYKEAYEGSIYIHQGETYIVQKMDLSNNTINVKKENTQFNTEPQVHIDVSVMEPIETKSFHYFNLTFGRVNVTEEYYSYRIKRRSTILNEFPLNLPPIKFDTSSFWIDIPPNFQAELLAKYDSKKLQGGIHGAEHAIIAMMPLHVLCDRKDLGGLSTLFDPQTGCARIFVYDGFLGGIGLCEKGYNIISNLLKSALDLVEGCKCDAIDGCPGCIHSPKCGNDNQTLDKEMTIKLLKSLL